MWLRLLLCLLLIRTNKDELDLALKEQKDATQTRARREFLDKGDNLLQRISCVRNWLIVPTFAPSYRDLPYDLR